MKSKYISPVVPLLCALMLSLTACTPAEEHASVENTSWQVTSVTPLNGVEIDLTNRSALEQSYLSDEVVSIIESFRNTSYEFHADGTVLMHVHNGTLTGSYVQEEDTIILMIDGQSTYATLKDESMSMQTLGAAIHLEVIK